MWCSVIYRYACCILIQKWVKMGVYCWAGPWPPVWETAVHLAVACGVFYGVFCVVLFPAGCLGWDLGLN